jgi:hypothetical protein
LSRKWHIWLLLLPHSLFLNIPPPRDVPGSVPRSAPRVAKAGVLLSAPRVAKAGVLLSAPRVAKAGEPGNITFPEECPVTSMLSGALFFLYPLILERFSLMALAIFFAKKAF